MFSKNFSGTFFLSEISEIRTGPLLYRSVRYASALNAYCDFLESILFYQLQFIMNRRIFLEHCRNAAIFFERKVNGLSYFFLIRRISPDLICDEYTFKNLRMMLRLFRFHIN